MSWKHLYSFRLLVHVIMQPTIFTLISTFETELLYSFQIPSTQLARSFEADNPKLIRILHI